ncbi:hypothetical protein Tdes44962_MAKER04476 [Teratosphaeria destructans]|uniref:Uncharacterized protein n=1 Tax=Teratosphaeria destructans TaxID=418781 RepID=A0A9W7SM92_9PEZI|nr:hypothetical protein Tdes44962_MAKER04476 [Teratosphaeria destructans]
MAEDDDAIQSFLATWEQSESSAAGSIPHAPVQYCCCGNDACVYLQHNQRALEGLEREVRTAAKLGQALLLRHETYVKDSERERKAMTAHIETLEEEKHQLEEKNASAIEENRGLLDQLETVNNAVAESDAQVTNLQATLLSTQQELHKLSGLAARAERLEQQLADFEREQVLCQKSLCDKEQSEKDALRRWREAERKLGDLQEQLERIENEAHAERERHVEVLGRMERRHAVEKELGSAAGRLQGAAAAKTSREAGGTNVVSHFVKDILQDNANLQMGIVELREMLQNSNDEVENLRKQMVEHQVADGDVDGDDATEPRRLPTRTDLRQEMQRAKSQELHVHHHYHAPAPVSKTSVIRRPKKKRYGALNSGHFTPPTSGYSTPRSSVSYGTPSSAATILNHTSVSVPQSTRSRNRLSTQSMQSNYSMLSSSGPSSPQSSTNHTPSIFDRGYSDAGQESSRPTTPDTEDSGSPYFTPMHSKRPSASSFRTFSAPTVHRRGISPGAGHRLSDATFATSLDAALMSTEQPHDVIPEETEGEWQDENPNIDSNAPNSDLASPLSDDLLEPVHNRPYYRSSPRRAASHESLMSVHGMDIHTIKPRPSQLLARAGTRSFTSQAVVSDAFAQAGSAAMSRPSDSGMSLLSGMAAERRLVSKPSMTSKMGGWLVGRWGATPTKSDDGKSTTSSIETSSITSAERSRESSASTLDPEATPKKPVVKLRSPGINQTGPILGLGPEIRVQHDPIVRKFDEEAMRKALETRSG